MLPAPARAQPGDGHVTTQPQPHERPDLSPDRGDGLSPRGKARPPRWESFSLQRWGTGNAATGQGAGRPDRVTVA